MLPTPETCNLKPETNRAQPETRLPIPLTRIFTRIFLSYLAIGLSSALIITVIYYFIMRDALIERTYDQLSSINILKRDRLDNYFEQTRSNTEFLLTRDLFLVKHFYQDPVTREKFVGEAASELQSIKSLLGFRSITVLDTQQGEVYSTDDDHPVLANLPEIRSHTAVGTPGESTDGPVVFFIDGSEAAGARGPTLLYVLKLPTAPFAPEHFTFIVMEENFQKVQDILNQNTGMGSTGESYLVGPDRRLRSSSRFFPEKLPLDISLNADPLGDSLHITRDYRDVEVISVHRSLGRGLPAWWVYSEIDLAEAMKPVNKLRNSLIVISILLLIVTIAVTAVVSNAITKPILYLREIIIKLSKGVVPRQRASVANQDEVGQIADAINLLIGGLERTTQFAYAIGEGQFDARFEKLSESDALGEALIHMRDQIKSLNEKEVMLVREKAAALLEGQETERKRITRELHDGVGQLLTVIRLRTEGITGHEGLVKEIKSLIAETSAEVRRISFNVMPSSLVDFGLEAALDGLCNQVKRNSGISIDYQYIREVEQAPAFDVVVAAYRIAQEALNNILKHSAGKNVSLHVIQKADELFMIIEDDGKGFSRNSKSPTGYGLRSMEERAKLLGGTVDVHSEVGKGTAIEVHMPLPVGSGSRQSAIVATRD